MLVTLGLGHSDAPRFVASYIENPSAHAALIRHGGYLRDILCNNISISAQTWDVLYSNVTNSKALESLVLNSTTARQASALLRDKRHVVKVNLINSSNPYVDASFLGEIFDSAPSSGKVLKALLGRPDLPLRVLDKVVTKPSLAYYVTRCVNTNVNVDELWIVNYFASLNSGNRSDFINNLPILLDGRESVGDFFLDFIFNNKFSISQKHLFAILICVSESRCLTGKQVVNMLSYVNNVASRTRSKFDVVTALLANPSLPQSLVDTCFDIIQGKSMSGFVSKSQWNYVENILDLRSSLPKVSLKPGWDYELNSAESQVFNSLSSKTFMFNARSDVQYKFVKGAKLVNSVDEISAHDLESASTCSLFLLMGKALKSVKYIEKEYANESESVWFNMLTLSSSWSGSLKDLLVVAKKL